MINAEKSRGESKLRHGNKEREKREEERQIEIFYFERFKCGYFADVGYIILSLVIKTLEILSNKRGNLFWEKS